MPVKKPLPHNPGDGKVIALNPDHLACRQTARRQLLEQLFAEHGRALRIFLKARVWRQEDVEDMVQEIFLKLADRPDLEACIGPQSGSNRGFLLTCGTNLLVDRLRKRSRHQRLDGQHQVFVDKATEVTPEQITQSEEELHLIMDAIHNLRPNWRKAFVLNRFHHLSYPQIANEMGVSVKQIQKFMSRALQRLRSVAAQLEDEAADGEPPGDNGND